jgi:hypothetical protein
MLAFRWRSAPAIEFEETADGQADRMADDARFDFVVVLVQKL